VLEDIFSPAQVQCLQQEQQQLWAAGNGSGNGSADVARIREPGDNTLRSIFSVHTVSNVFARLASTPGLVKVARFLLDDDVYIHQSRLNYKPGFRGREFYWHSDFETWHVEDGMPRMRALSMSIALTENSVSNGPLMLLPGSHKRFVACTGNTPENHFRQSLRKQEYGVPPDDLITQLAEDGGIVTVDAKPGSVLVFDCNAIHGSNGNITPFPRANAFIVYNAISNRVGEPYCDRPPRPEYVCTRRSISPLDAGGGV
jgi:ectoine hydroxylase